MEALPFFQSTCPINLMVAAHDLSVIFAPRMGYPVRLATFISTCTVPRWSTRQSGSHHVSSINR